MTNRFRVATTLARKLDELGVSPADVLRQAGLPMGLFDQEKILVSTEEFFAFYRGLAQASRDPAIGLKLGIEPRVERYSPIAIAAVSARSFRDALQRLARYKQLTCPEELAVAERGDECRVQFRWLLAQETEPPVLVDVCFARVVDIARRGIGGPSPRSALSFAERQGTARCTKRTLAARWSSMPVRTRSCSTRRTSIAPSSRTMRICTQWSHRSSRPSCRRRSCRRPSANRSRAFSNRCWPGAGQGSRTSRESCASARGRCNGDWPRRARPSSSYCRRRAATLTGRSLTEFVVSSLQEAATRAIHEHELITLSRGDQQLFVRALLSSPAPNQKLRRAAQAYKSRVRG